MSITEMIPDIASSLLQYIYVPVYIIDRYTYISSRSLDDDDDVNE